MKRFRRWLLWVLPAFLFFSLVPVLLLRWMPPPSTAVILARTIDEGRPPRFRWVPLERICPEAALAEYCRDG